MKWGDLIATFLTKYLPTDVYIRHHKVARLCLDSLFDCDFIDWFFSSSFPYLTFFFVLIFVLSPSLPSFLSCHAVYLIELLQLFLLSSLLLIHPVEPIVCVCTAHTVCTHVTTLFLHLLCHPVNFNYAIYFFVFTFPIFHPVASLVWLPWSYFHGSLCS